MQVPGEGRWRQLSAEQDYEVRRETREERVKMERARASWGKLSWVLMQMVMIMGRSFFVERSWDDQKSEYALWGLAVGAGLYPELICVNRCEMRSTRKERREYSARPAPFRKEPAGSGLLLRAIPTMKKAHWGALFSVPANTGKPIVQRSFSYCRSRHDCRSAPWASGR
ncbi:hypothetical protein F506_08955 [Herbaspirillum hiltneri N3]|uniref:Uncharacterized protein n=1 Tax=Herbaspirillum hiltneri N3 TaxID=1262470 RepID=A0ABM5UZL7_9BURK|nr:hypothetical protein F506_08955 [Herbaspirillum hiltneri N3]